MTYCGHTVKLHFNLGRNGTLALDEVRNLVRKIEKVCRAGRFTGMERRVSLGYTFIL